MTGIVRRVSFSFSTPAVRQGLSVAAVILIVDQAVKAFFLYGLDFISYGPGDRIEVLPFFDLVMVWNQGISYGLFQMESAWGKALLVVFALTVVVFLTLWLNSLQKGLLAWAIGFVIGGALGNVIDRLLYGAVADFFHLYAYGYHWYVFNVADAFIVIGVAAMLYDSILGNDKRIGGSGGSGD